MCTLSAGEGSEPMKTDISRGKGNPGNGGWNNKGNAKTKSTEMATAKEETQFTHRSRYETLSTASTIDQSEAEDDWEEEPSKDQIEELKVAANWKME